MQMFGNGEGHQWWSKFTIQYELAEIWLQLLIAFRSDYLWMTKDRRRGRITHRPAHDSKASRFTIGTDLRDLMFFGEPKEKVRNFQG